MKKIEKTLCDGKRYRTEIFADLYEFSQTVNSRPVNRHEKALDRIPRSIRADDDSAEFTGSASWDESIRLMNGGYTEGLRMIEALPKLKRDPKPRRRIFADVVGVTPHIPNVVMDIDPRDMWNIKRVPQPSAEINIYYDRAVSWYRSANDIAKSARLLLDTIAAIEAAGTKVNLYAMCSVCDDKYREFINCVVQIKRASQQVNALMMAYPLVHPSFYRRQLFRWMETTPIVSYRSTVKVHGTNPSWSISHCRTNLIEAGILDAKDYYLRCENIVDYTSIDYLIADMNEQSELKTARAI